MLHFKMEHYIPYSLLCDLFSKNVEAYLQGQYHKRPSLCSSPLLGIELVPAFEDDGGALTAY